MNNSFFYKEPMNNLFFIYNYLFIYFISIFILHFKNLKKLYNIYIAIGAFWIFIWFFKNDLKNSSTYKYATINKYR